MGTCSTLCDVPKFGFRSESIVWSDNLFLLRRWRGDASAHAEVPRGWVFREIVCTCATRRDSVDHVDSMRKSKRKRLAWIDLVERLQT